jgi:hypothetical protein
MLKYLQFQLTGEKKKISELSLSKHSLNLMDPFLRSVMFYATYLFVVHSTAISVAQNTGNFRGT